MLAKYKEWIASHFPTPESAKSACGSACREMVEAFPELKAQPGHVRAAFILYGQFWKNRISEHWWCLTASGEIIDPTAHQFDTVHEYIPWPVDEPIPTGKCPNCGDLCYNGDYCCSKECHASYAAYCNSFR